MVTSSGPDSAPQAQNTPVRPLGGGGRVRPTPLCWVLTILAGLVLVSTDNPVLKLFDMRAYDLGNGVSGVVRTVGRYSYGAEETIPRDEYYGGYVPSPVERYFVNNSARLGWDKPNNPVTCAAWKDPEATELEIYDGLRAYAADLEAYLAKVRNVTRPAAGGKRFDVLERIKRDGHHGACDELRLHPDGLPGIFESGQLSWSRSGWVEPLAPPMRSHKICFDSRPRLHILSLDYLVHDFEHMCRDLRPTSRRVFIDMGAALDFYGKTDQPNVALLRLYEKFGFRFDHIYGFEIKFTDPKQVFGKLLPAEYFAAYHWINAGVSPDAEDKMNPLYSILQEFSEDDFVVVKLDVDTASVEVPLARQLLEGGPNGTYHRLVDQFYFEHHVHLGELAPWWGASMEGTVKESLDLFYGLRERGIPSHFWP